MSYPVLLLIFKKLNSILILFWSFVDLGPFFGNFKDQPFADILFIVCKLLNLEFENLRKNINFIV